MFKGRINREQFLKANALLWTLTIAFGGLLTLVFVFLYTAILNLGFTVSVSIENVIISDLVSYVSIYGPLMLIPFFIIIALLFDLGLLVRRMHDLNFTGWMALLPNMWAVAFVAKGIEGSNNYGDPMTYTTSLKALLGRK